MKNRIIIDGKDFTQFSDGLDQIKESVSEKDGATYVAQTTTITLFESGYTKLRQMILENTCEAINQEFAVQIWYSNCRKTFDYILKAQGVSFDPIKCTAKINLNSNNAQSDQIDILKSTYFWDLNEGFLDYVKSLNRIPKMLYVKELTWISISILILFFLIADPLILVINTIITAINLLPGIYIDTIDREAAADDVMGGGECSPLFYLKDIFEFWATKAGLTFESSIFQSDPYELTALWSQQLEKGIEFDNVNKQDWVENNLPNMSALEVLDSMKGVFNTKMAIIGNKLVLERHDLIDKQRKELFNLDFEIKEGRIENEVEITFDNQPNYARFLGDYRFDSVDTQGNRAMSIMRDYEEWNPSKFKNRKGDLRPDGIYGATRFTADEHKNKFNSWVWDTAGGFYPGGYIQYTHALVLTNDTAQNPKLIVIDQNTVRKGSKGELYHFPLKRQLEPGQGGGLFESGPGKHEYNYPLWFKDSSQSKGLYKLFWEIDHPDNHQIRVTEIPSLKWRPENFCETVDFLKENGLMIKIGSASLGDGNIGSYEIDYPNCSINLQDIKFKCDGSAN